MDTQIRTPELRIRIGHTFELVEQAKIFAESGEYRAAIGSIDIARRHTAQLVRDFVREKIDANYIKRIENAINVGHNYVNQICGAGE